MHRTGTWRTYSQLVLLLAHGYTRNSSVHQKRRDSLVALEKRQWFVIWDSQWFTLSSQFTFDTANHIEREAENHTATTGDREHRRILTSVGLALAMTMKRPACSELLIHCLLPLMMKWSPSFTACVFSANASDPDSGSDKQKLPTCIKEHIKCVCMCVCFLWWTLRTFLRSWRLNSNSAIGSSWNSFWTVRYLLFDGMRCYTGKFAVLYFVVGKPGLSRQQRFHPKPQFDATAMKQ